MASSLGTELGVEISTPIDKQNSAEDDGLGPHLTFYGSEPQLRVTTPAPPFQPPPTAEQLDHIYRPEKLLQARSLDSSGNTYLDTFVLLLSWEDEDPRLPVRTEIERLSDVFQRLYHFKVERWKIPSEDPHIRLNEKILALVKLGDDREDCLKIVYYAGHGKLTRNRQSMWTDHCGRILIWAGIQNALEQAKSDALILIDSCDSGTANTDQGSGVTELVAAGGFNTTANGVGPWSFTHALVAELRLLSNGRPFTVAKLHNRIVSRMQNQIPDGEEYHEPFEILPTERFVTPVHVVLTEDQLSISRRIQLRRNNHTFISLPKPPDENVMALQRGVAHVSLSRPPTPLPSLSFSKLTSVQIEPSIARPSSTSSLSHAERTKRPLMETVAPAQQGLLNSVRSLLFETEEGLQELEHSFFQKSPRRDLNLGANSTGDELQQILRHMKKQMWRHKRLLPSLKIGWHRSINRSKIMLERLLQMVAFLLWVLFEKWKLPFWKKKSHLFPRKRDTEYLPSEEIVQYHWRHDDFLTPLIVSALITFLLMLPKLFIMGFRWYFKIQIVETSDHIRTL